MPKEYGRLSLEQLKALMRLEAGFGHMQESVHEALKAAPTHWGTVRHSLQPWAGFYDGPVLTQVAAFVCAFGFVDSVKAAAQSADPQQAVLDYVEEPIPEEELTEDKRDARLKAWGLLVGLVLNFDCLRVFGRYINDLVDEGRNGNDKAYFDAIRIDPTVICTKSFETRLSRAVLERDGQFMNALRLALRGKTKKHQSQLNRVRFAIQALLELNGLSLSDDELYALFVEKLRLYSAGEDAPKALRKHIRKQKTSSTTQKP